MTKFLLKRKFGTGYITTIMTIITFISVKNWSKLKEI